jgi:hypothetical protein
MRARHQVAAAACWLGPIVMGDMQDVVEDLPS